MNTENYDTKSKYNEYKSEYENYAVDIYAKLYELDWENTEKCSGWPQVEWANMTSLDFAEFARANKFLALPGYHHS